MDPLSYFSQPRSVGWLRLALALQALGLMVLAGVWGYGGLAELEAQGDNPILTLVIALALALQTLAIALGLFMAKRWGQSQSLPAPALQQEMSYGRVLFEASLDGVVILDAVGNVVEANHSFAQMLGYTSAEITALNVADFEADFASVNGEPAISLSEPWPTRLDRCYRRKDGSTYAVEISATTVEWGGQPAKLCICRDVSDRTQVEARAHELETRYLSILEAQTELIARFTRDGRLIFVNDAYCRYFGLSREQLEGQSYEPMIYAPDQPLIDEALAVLSPERPFSSVENRVYAKGEVRWTKWTNKAIYESDGTLIELQSVGQDIHDRKQAELALADSEARFQQLAAASPAVIYTVVESPQGVVRFDYISPAAEEVHEIPVAELMQNGALISAQIHPDDRSQYVEAYLASLQAMELFACEWRIITPSGKIKWLRASSRPEQRQNGEVAWHGIALDISIRKQAELAVKSLQTALLEAQQVAHVGNWEFDLVSQKITWSAELFRMFGLDPAQGEPVYSDYLTMLHPDDAVLLQRAVDQAVAAATPYCIDYRAILSDGSIRYHEGRCQVECDRTGRVQRLFGTALDITDRKQTEMALRSSQLRLQLALANSGTGIWDWNMQTNESTFEKQHWQALLGLDADTTLEDNVAEWESRIHPDDKAQVYADIAEHIAGKTEIYESTHRIRCQDGTYKWLLCQGKLIEWDGQGQPTRFIGIYRDVTEKMQLDAERKQAAAALQASETRLRAIFDQALAGINQIDLSGQFTEANQYFCDLLGYSRAELLTLKLEDILHPEDFEQNRAQIDQILRGEIESLNLEQRQRHRSGDWIWTEVMASLLRDGAGQVIGNLSVVVDIRERLGLEAARQQAEQTIRHQAERETLLREISQRIRQSLDLSTIFDTACQEILACLQADRVGIFKFLPGSGYTNCELVAESVVQGFPSMVAAPVYAYYLGESHGTLYAKGHYYAIDDIFDQGLDPCYADLLAQFQVRANLVMPLIHGHDLWGLLCIHQCSGPRCWQPTEIDLGQQLANQLAIAVQQSYLVEELQQELAERQHAQQQITERNQELAIANQDLSRATRLKDEFLATMSHELRTPLNAILGFAQILNADPSLQAQQRDYIRIMHRSGDHLLHLINDILDLSKIEANRIVLEPESIDLFSLLYDLQAMFQERAEDSDLRFTLILAPDLPQHIVIDPNKLRQVLINLLGNAIKFTDEGEVTLKVSLKQPLEVSASGPAETGAELLFAVVDTGIGIAPDELTVIFDAFTQTKVGRTALEGTGLGLTISRSLVYLMGGALAVDSTQGEGSTFWVSLPLHLARAEDVAPSGNTQPVIALAPEQPAYRILVVDDQPENRYLLVAALSQIGLAVQEATQGAEAIACCRQWRPHLIWMDLRMLDLDGCEVTRRIRAEAKAYDKPYAPVIIALTAQASREERNRALAAGCDDFLSKPVQLEQIFTKMADHLGLRYRYAEPEPTAATKPAAASPQLDATALQAMPPAWIANLHQAALLCDSHATAQLLQQISPEHASLGDRLNRLLQEYKFEVIMQLTQPGTKPSS